MADVGNESGKRKILIVEDDPVQLRLMEQMIADFGNQILTASNGRDALQIIGSDEPRIVITDWIMPEMTGLDLCRALRIHEGVRFVYLIVVTAQAGPERVVEAFDAGADDYLTKPLNKAELLARLRAAERIVTLESDLASRTREIHRVNAEMALAHQKLNEANEQLRRMAVTDELTGLLNRREALNRLAEMWAARGRYGQNFSCIMLDIDHFKSFNDHHGHAAGDYVLREAARLLKNNVRKTDKVCRIGGEEFLILCPNVGVHGAFICAEHVRASVEQHVFKYEGTDLHVTISLGVAQPSERMKDPDHLMKLVDSALYESKNQGRNRVTLAEPSSQVSI
ncbi:MAG: diguanylate cyclase [Phycisphaerae bacterium]